MAASDAVRAARRRFLRGERVEMQALAEELGGDKAALAMRCDVTDWEQQQALVAAALERFGQLDAAFANAGFGGPRGFLSDTVEH